LLEYCCKTNYQMLVKKIQAEHRKELESQEQEFVDVQDRLFDNEKKLKMEVDRLSKENDELKRQLSEQVSTSTKLKEDMEFQAKNHEEEV